MIEFTYLTDFNLKNEKKYTEWIISNLRSLGVEIDLISYVFADDELVYDLNKRFLKHDTLTDILTFEEAGAPYLKGEIVISLDRVKENAKELRLSFEEELRRVMAHGVLHLLGHKDETKEDKEIMRLEEDKWIKLFHVEL